MGNSAFEKVNLKQARRLLSALSDLARESSLTGSLEKGTKVAVRQYNGLLDHLTLRPARFPKACSHAWTKMKIVSTNWGSPASC